MKKTICIVLLMAMITFAFGQQTDYLQKSKKQKTGAFILLGGGSTLIVAGLLIGDSKSSTFGEAGTGVIMGGIGTLSILGSIPLFIASGKNKRKAIAASAFFKMETTPVIQNASFVSRSYPALSVKINL